MFLDVLKICFKCLLFGEEEEEVPVKEVEDVLSDFFSPMYVLRIFPICFFPFVFPELFL